MSSSNPPLAVVGQITPSTRKLDYRRVTELLTSNGCTLPAVQPERVEAESVAQLAQAFHTLVTIEERLSKTLLELKERQWRSNTANVLGAPSIQHRTHMLEQLTVQIRRILEHRVALLKFLKQPHIGDHIIVAPADQKLLVQLLQDIARSLTQYTEDQARSQWLQNAQLLDESMTEALHQITKLVAMYSNYTDALTAVGDRLAEQTDQIPPSQS